MTRAQGAYLLSGHEGPYAVERFRSGRTSDGRWTYRATRHDPSGTTLLGRLEVEVGEEVRLHVEAGGWVLRGGTVGPGVLWRRGEQEHEAVAGGFSGSSPGLAVATLLRSRLAVGESRRLRAVLVSEPVLATRTVDEQWSRPADDRVEVLDLGTGEARALRVEDGLVTEGTGLVLTGLTRA